MKNEIDEASEKVKEAEEKVSKAEEKHNEDEQRLKVEREINAALTEDKEN